MQNYSNVNKLQSRAYLSEMIRLLFMVFTIFVELKIVSCSKLFTLKFCLDETSLNRLSHIKNTLGLATFINVLRSIFR